MRKKLRRFVAGLLCGIIILTNAGLEETVCAASIESSAVENGAAETGTATGESQETATEVETTGNQETVEDPVAEGTEGQEKPEESREAEKDPIADDTQGQEETEKEPVEDQPVTENPETT